LTEGVGSENQEEGQFLVFPNPKKSELFKILG